MERAAVGGDEDPGAPQQRDQAGDAAARRDESSGAVSRVDDFLREVLLARPAGHADFGADSSESHREFGPGVRGPALERAERARARVDEDESGIDFAGVGGNVTERRGRRSRGILVELEVGEEGAIEHAHREFVIDADSRRRDQRERAATAMQVARNDDGFAIQPMRRLARGFRPELSPGADREQLQRTLQVALEVDGDVVFTLAQRAAMPDQPPRRGRSGEGEATPREGDHPIDAFDLTDHVGEAILDDEVDDGIGTIAAQRGQRRQRVHDVAQGRQSQEEVAFGHVRILPSRIARCEPSRDREVGVDRRGEGIGTMTSMSDAATATRPSAEYRELRSERGFTLVREDLAAALARTNHGSMDPFEYRFAILGHVGGGRKPLSRVELEGSGVRAIHKVLRRGGWLGGILGERALPSRARREAEVVATLSRAAVPCVGLLAIRAVRDRWLPWLARIELLTEPVDDAVDLFEYFFATDAARGGKSHRRMLTRAGQVVAAMHRAGVFHVDLNLRNLLVAPGGEVLLLDFGASRIGELSLDERAANLARLWRSCVKRRLDQTRISRTDVMRFVRGYDPRAAHEVWRRAARRFERTIGFHRWLW